MPNKEPNPNKLRQQRTPDSPPPRDHGKRHSPDHDPDWIAVGHEEADAGVPATHGDHAGGRERPRPPRRD